MRHLDLLQHLGTARSALDKAIAKETKPDKVSALLKTRDDVSHAMTRVIDVRDALPPVEAAAAHAKLAAMNITAANAFSVVETVDEVVEQWTAVCDHHGALPPPSVSLAQATLVRNRHLKLPANKSCGVDLQRVR